MSFPLIGSACQNVIAWPDALATLTTGLPVWRIHPRAGMRGGLVVPALRREANGRLPQAGIESLQQDHLTGDLARAGSVPALPGAPELLAALTGHRVARATATSGPAAMARPALPMPHALMVTREMVTHAKPGPDLFFAATATPRGPAQGRDSSRGQHAGPAGPAAGRFARDRVDVAGLLN